MSTASKASSERSLRKDGVFGNETILKGEIFIFFNNYAADLFIYLIHVEMAQKRVGQF